MTPIKILIVEDDAGKAERLRKTLLSIEGLSADCTYFVSDAKTAKSYLTDTSFDILILDLNLPGDPDTAAKSGTGLKMLRQVCASPRYKRPLHVIFLSAFTDELETMKKEIEGRSWHSIHYENNSDSWSEELIHKIEYILSSRFQRKKTECVYDCMFITALDAPEFEALRQVHGSWSPVENANKRLIETRVGEGSAMLKFGACSAPQMGGTASAVLALEMIKEFAPKFIVMCGITAGIAGVCEIGDILAADPCWEWASGKYSQRGKKVVFEQAPVPIRASAAPILALRDTSLTRRLMTSAVEAWQGKAPSHTPRVRIGPMVSGSSVVASPVVVRQIKKQHRKLNGLEMESYGMYYAASTRGGPGVGVSIRQICV